MRRLAGYGAIFKPLFSGSLSPRAGEGGVSGAPNPPYFFDRLS